MSINIIAAMSKNRVIGYKNRLPWYIPEDLKHFKRLTSEKNTAVVMGRKTWESLPIKPLPNRRNFILTKNNMHSIFPDGLVLTDFDDIKILKKNYSNIWIIGGESIYEHYINKPYIDKIYLTEIEEEYEGDTYFPEIPKYFCKTIQGPSKLYKVNSLKFGSYNMNMYSNCSFPRHHISSQEITYHNKGYQ